LLTNIPARENIKVDNIIKDTAS